MDPVHAQAICNATGNQEDNFAKPIVQMENYIALPPDDAKDILRKLKVCEGARSGD